MIAQHTLRANPGAKKAKRIRGRGDASGRGSFSGRGCKGQKARSGGKIPAKFEGGQSPLVQRMPKLRGFTNINRVAYQVVNLEKLNTFNDGDTVDLIALFEHNFISKKTLPLKILGTGDLAKKLIVKADAFSTGAKKKIEDKGGQAVTPTVKSGQ